MSRLLLVIVAALLMGAGLKTPGQPYPVTKNDPATIDRAIKEIYHRFDAYLDTLPMVQSGDGRAVAGGRVVYLDQKYADTGYEAVATIATASGGGCPPLWTVGNDNFFYVYAKTDSSFTLGLSSGDGDSVCVNWITVGRRKR
jgi:hypothetical protein